MPAATVSAASTSVDIPAILNAEYVVPVLVLAFLALNVGSDPKYAELRTAVAALLRNPGQIVPEALGLIAVALAVGAGLLLRPDGLRAEESTLAALRAEDEYKFELRRLWPTLLNPDSLLIIQQLLVGLGAMLLLARGACARGSGSLALSMLLVTIAHGARTQQWIEGENYTPEGPLGHHFAAVCACVSLTLLCAATLRSVCSCVSSVRSAIRGAANLMLLLAFCAWVANDNYLAASDTKRPDLTFSFVYAVELCAAPLLLAAAYHATEEVANLGGALMVLALAQAAAVWWFLDFSGLLQDPNSEDPVVQHDIKIKNTLKTIDQGHAYALFAVSHAVRVLSGAAACVIYAVLRLSRPESVQSKPNGVPLLRVEPIIV